jgi:hypothetical protein
MQPHYRQWQLVVVVQVMTATLVTVVVVVDLVDQLPSSITCQ